MNLKSPLPMGGPCVMSMSVSAGILFHNAKHSSPLSALKPQPPK